MMQYTNLLRSLNGYIDNYMPNLRSIFERRPNYRKAMEFPDGNIYQLPSVAENANIQSPTELFINKKWLDALGLPIPKTTEQFYQTLKAFKTRDPNAPVRR